MEMSKEFERAKQGRELHLALIEVMLNWDSENMILVFLLSTSDFRVIVCLY